MPPPAPDYRLSRVRVSGMKNFAELKLKEKAKAQANANAKAKAQANANAQAKAAQANAQANAEAQAKAAQANAEAKAKAKAAQAKALANAEAQYKHLKKIYDDEDAKLKILNDLDAKIDALEANFKLKLIPITDPRVVNPRFIIKNSKRALNIKKGLNDSRAKVRDSRDAAEAATLSTALAAGRAYATMRDIARAIEEEEDEDEDDDDDDAEEDEDEVPHKGGRSTRRNRKNKKSRKYTRRN